jgi:hypothetical protein
VTSPRPRGSTLPTSPAATSSTQHAPVDLPPPASAARDTARAL